MSIIHRRDFIRNSGAYSAGAFMFSHLDWAGNTGTTGLPRATPESTGVSSESIIQYLQEANKSGLEHHGFMFLRHGKVIAEAYWRPFERHQVHTLYSLSKSFTSTAVGLAVKEGLIKLNDKVISFFPELLPEVVSDNLAKMEIHHALSMATGHTVDTIPSMRAAQNVSWIKTFLARPVEKEPGTHFLYNTGSSYILSAIVSKVSGQSVQEYLSSRLYKPLGITQSDWEQSPEG
ncbi:MAG: serine hydrolase, partial [Saprospiraceae bacterium]|nr:serine hydrolase [Saprospiraceae bacterium]